ncbi:MAG TPA: PPE domain-containing protein [Jatrophihabitans sp.]|nr:PPE domain-containing protein [Jatrophihabitans sp.]
MSESLVAEKEGPTATAGAGLLNDVANLATDQGALDFTLDGVSFGLDALSMTLDPFGAIASAGVGWLLNHVSFLRDFLDQLTGDAAQIQAVADTWRNVERQLFEAGDQYRGALSGVATWSGAAADDYRAAADDYIRLLEATAQQCNSTAEGVEIAGILVGTERALVYEALSGFIGRCVVEAVAALASSWFTFGGSIAAFVAVVDVDASIQAEKFAMGVGDLMRKIGQLAHRLDGISTHADELGTAITRAAGTLRMRAGGAKGLKTIAKNRYLRNHPDGVVAALNQFEHSGVHEHLHAVRDAAEQKRVGVPREVARQYDEARKQQGEAAQP